MPKPKDLVGRVSVKLSNFKPDVRDINAATANNPKRPDHGIKGLEDLLFCRPTKRLALDNLSNIRSTSDLLVARYQSTTKGRFHLSEQTSTHPSIFSYIFLDFLERSPSLRIHHHDAPITVFLLSRRMASVAVLGCSRNALSASLRSSPRRSQKEYPITQKEQEPSCCQSRTQMVVRRNARVMSLVAAMTYDTIINSRAHKNILFYFFLCFPRIINYSWDEQLEKNVPLKVGLGLTLFAATSLPAETKQTIADQASQITSKVRDTVVETTQSIQSTLQSMGNANREMLDSVVDQVVGEMEQDQALSGGTASIPELTLYVPNSHHVIPSSNQQTLTTFTPAAVSLLLLSLNFQQFGQGHCGRWRPLASSRYCRFWIGSVSCPPRHCLGSTHGKHFRCRLFVDRTNLCQNGCTQLSRSVGAVRVARHCVDALLVSIAQNNLGVFILFHGVGR